MSKETHTGAKARRFLFWLSMVLTALPVAGHVGSPDVFYEGDAGPYHLFVVVRVPQVIPGVAEVEVRSSSLGVEEVRILTLRLAGAGAELAPTPEKIERYKQDPQWFTGSLWFMESGALQIRVQVSGAKGKGELAVPVPAMAQRKLPMAKPLATGLFALLLLLTLSALAIVVAGAREASLAPGESPSAADQRRARRVMLVASITLFAFLYLGKKWWNVDDAAAAARIYKPPHMSAILEGGNRLVLTTIGVDYLSDLIPDHGHLMHLFLIRMPGMDHFAHLHPDQASGGQFTAQLPSMPTGHYQVFADIVHQSGFPATMLGEVDLPDISGKSANGDDCEWSGAPINTSAIDMNVSQLPDGGRMVWERRGTLLKAGVPAVFRFRIQDKNGDPASNLEPYMGMAGHAEFVRSDLTTFAHVHPAGSVSMAALSLAQEGLQGPGSAPSEMAMPMSLSPEISFPYGFPRPGDYRIFVQIKRAGRVETGVFDAHVN